MQPVAYLDREFLDSDEARPLRILAEYLEPLRRFQAQNIQDTVVFFGSARVSSREHADAQLTSLTRRLAGLPVGTGPLRPLASIGTRALDCAGAEARRRSVTARGGGHHGRRQREAEVPVGATA